jgi:hypothetical protein
MSNETEEPNDEPVPDDAAADFGLQTSSLIRHSPFPVNQTGRKY